MPTLDYHRPQRVLRKYCTVALAYYASAFVPNVGGFIILNFLIRNPSSDDWHILPLVVVSLTGIYLLTAGVVFLGILARERRGYALTRNATGRACLFAFITTSLVTFWIASIKSNNGFLFIFPWVSTLIICPILFVLFVTRRHPSEPII